MGSHAERGAKSTKPLQNKKHRAKSRCLVQLKGLAPLRYHAGVANDGCPSFVADMPLLIAVCLRYPPVQVPYVLRIIKKWPPLLGSHFYGAVEGTCKERSDGIVKMTSLLVKLSVSHTPYGFTHKVRCNSTKSLHEKTAKLMLSGCGAVEGT